MNELKKKIKALEKSLFLQECNIEALKIYLRTLKEGEKSGPKPDGTFLETTGKASIGEITPTDSKPSDTLREAREAVLRGINTSSLAQREKTTVVETQNFVDVREFKDYSEKSYKLIAYDNKETYIAKQHVVRTESIEGGGTRVIVSQKSAWAITKLEWK